MDQEIPKQRKPSRRRWRIVVALGACVLTSLLRIPFLPAEKEPEYQGKKLSEWLAIYGRRDMLSDPANEAAAAVRHIGAKAVPILLKWLKADSANWTSKISGFYFKHPGWPGNKIVVERVRARRARQMVLCEYAVTGFALLGEKAKQAIPELTKAAGGSMMNAIPAIKSFPKLGSDAMPPLLTMLANTNEFGWKRHAVLGAMENMTYLGSKAVPAIPVLIQCAMEMDPVIGPCAQRILSNFSYADDSILRRAAVRAVADVATDNEWAYGIIAQRTNSADHIVQAAALDGIARGKAFNQSTVQRSGFIPGKLTFGSAVGYNGESQLIRIHETDSAFKSPK